MELDAAAAAVAPPRVSVVTLEASLLVPYREDCGIGGNAVVVVEVVEVAEVGGTEGEADKPALP